MSEREREIDREKQAGILLRHNAEICVLHL